MGEARANDRNSKAIAFGKSLYCIFCGGDVEADTVEHYPPKSVFSQNKWPEGYVFPACQACNHGTREEDLWVAFLSRMDPADVKDEMEAARVVKLFRALRSRHPTAISSMFGGSNVQARNLSKRFGIKPAPGELYRDIPLVPLPEIAHGAIEIFATKLTKALHFHHTSRIVPTSYGFKYRWFTNASYMEGKIPTEIFSVPTGIPMLTRTDVDLSDQFNYRFIVSEDGEMGIFTVMLRFAFCFTSVLSFDKEFINSIEEENVQTEHQ